MNKDTKAINSARVRIIAKQLGLSGQNILFENEGFFGLNPGDKITQIGNGKENGTIRTDKFPFACEYVGSIICQFEKPENMFAFKIPEKNNEDDMYFIYGSTGTEIFTEAVFSMKDRLTGKISGYMRFYAPEFIKL
ncbi:MAG: hypothetical protein VB066_01850 [Paludibacter sp.]|nr:hypothetical protein [Paludibacter sp.]